MIMATTSNKHDNKDLLRILQCSPWVKDSVSKSNFLEECHRLSRLEGLGFFVCISSLGIDLYRFLIGHRSLVNDRGGVSVFSAL